MRRASPSTVLCLLRLVACSLATALSFGLARASSALAGFALESTTLPVSGPIEINRPIDLRFTEPIDFATVSGSTVQITDASTGAPAVGDFTLPAPDVVRFQPRCPSRADLADAGMSPGRTWRLVIPDASSGGPTVVSTSGQALAAGISVEFETKAPPTPVFLDVVAGAPSPVIRGPGVSRHASRLELAGDARLRVDFEPRAVPDPALGADVPAGFRAPLNLASAQRTHVAIVVVLDQMIALDDANTSPARVRLEHEVAPGTWEALAREVELVASCTPIGATLRVTPGGVLPQDRRVRVVLGAGFADVVGEALASDVVVGTFQVAIATDPGTTTPGDAADERFEGFDSVALEDRSFAPPAGTLARWGEDGTLEGAAFEGTGGPNGTFDWVIETGEVFVLDTTFTVIADATQTSTTTVVNGRVDVRSLWVKAGGVLVVQGPNPCTILASGLAPGQTAGILVEGRIHANGRGSSGVVTFNTANIPEPGAAGAAGGGRGGTGSFLTTQSTPQGESGYGAFGAPGGGGGGGESGFNAQFTDSFRRPGGGGGGRLGHDQMELARGTCPDQRVIGLDVERGFDGAPQAQGALPPAHSPPRGGAAGPSPFVDLDPDNDFWGALVTPLGALVVGELAAPLGGSGGGGGGDACRTSSFPTTPFTPFGDEKGAGGGGGGGVLVLRALHPIRVGGAGAAARARVSVNGGHGGGGENTLNLNRVGGGSGGGSGGHLVLESASQIDLSQLTAASSSGSGQTWGGLFARGGQGGAGENNVGGSGSLGVETSPELDALPPIAYPSATAPCGIVAGSNDAAASVPTGVASPATLANPPQFVFTNSIGDASPANPRTSAGGDGGPGIIQLHVPTLADVLVPLQATPQRLVDFRDVCMPLPVGAAPANANAPSQWGHVLPSFGRFSFARSRWMALGAPEVAPGTGAPDAIDFVFRGTDPSTGSVLTSGGGAPVLVQELAPIASGTLAPPPALPSLGADLRSVLLDGSTVDDLYRRNPNLVRGYVLRVAGSDFVVGAATYSALAGVFRVYVEGSGTPLAGSGPGASVALVPRFFVAGSDGQANVLAEPDTIRIELQVAPANASGLPDEAQASPWHTDATQLGASVARPRFLRFRVRFDAAPSGTFGAGTPQPFLDFLRVALRF